MAKTYHVDLTLEERSLLEDIVKRRLSTSEAVKRSFVLLAPDRLGNKKWNDSKSAHACIARRFQNGMADLSPSFQR